ncbi:methyl-accepting chemotaxis citrate transducer [Duganella rhizosphaerae]|uniref:methyl-accepting chemotaxis protein n=1 Tax=Duganella rhizosphaerae TaxID=2885763 RepID=UPI0030E79C0A
MKKLSVRAQLAIAFGAMTLLLIGIAVLSIVNYLHQFKNFEHYVNGVRARSEHAHLVREAVDLRAIAARNLVLLTNPVERDAEAKIVAKAQSDVIKNLQALNELAKDSSVSEDARRLIGKIDSTEKLYAPVALAIVDLALHDKKAEAIIKMNEECRPLLATLISVSNEYAELTAARSAQLIEEASEDFAASRTLLLLASAIAVVMAVAAGMLISRSLLKALGAEPMVLCEAVTKVADGDLSCVLPVRSEDTRSVLAALQRMQISLSTVVTSVRRDSETVSVAAAEISSGNNDLSSRTEQQASSLEETASSMEELTSTVRQSAENARQANALAITASDFATKGGAVVDQVVGTMSSISAASREIVNIISVIDGIAFQTNILALNAAVEAARAGEQGRGFAVVASEVRNLAQRSASAAKEIKALIDNSVHRVDIGTQLANDAGQTMADVVSSVKQVTDMIAEIMSASLEQSAGIEQVNQAIIEMDNVTQQNASLVEEAAAAAESLRDQAANLVQTVSVFKTRKGSGDQENTHQTAQPRKTPSSAMKVVATNPTPRPRLTSVTTRARSAGSNTQAAVADWEEF